MPRRSNFRAAPRRGAKKRQKTEPVKQTQQTNPYPAIYEAILEFVERRKRASLGDIMNRFPERQVKTAKRALKNLLLERKISEISRGLYERSETLDLIGEFEAIILANELEKPLPKSVKVELEQIPEKLSAKEIARRKDYRNLPLVTIDPEDARDFDDAICVQRLSGGFRLIVAISDVSHFIQFKSKLDLWVRKFGTSVYLPHRAVHMIPEKLAASMCSLRPDEEKPILAVEIEYGSAGNIKNYSIYEGVMRSSLRLDYKTVQNFFEGKPVQMPEDVAETLNLARELAEKLRVLRKGRGSLEFDFPEPKVHLKDDKITKIQAEEHLFSQDLVEEFMLAANYIVADFCLENDLPAIYRVHEEPELEDVTEVAAQATKLLGRPFNADLKSLRSMLEAARGKKFERILHFSLLRAMMQARYSEKNLGHYALAFDKYLHFTSPIRRYPDLMVHRAVKARLQKRELDIHPAALAKMAKKLSEDERKAMEIEREALNLARAMYMREHIGETFPALVVSVMEYGCFVEVTKPGFFVEGLLPVGMLPGDYYIYKAEDSMLIGERSKKAFRVGDKLNVELIDVNIGRRHITFGLAAKSEE